jgi:3-phosphoshikimate 1-carboxyvinyltransferase
LIGASLENGLEIELQGEITSRSYIKMTLKILKDIGIETRFEGI